MELCVASLKPILELSGDGEINQLAFGTRGSTTVCVATLLDKHASPIAVVDDGTGFRNTFPLSGSSHFNHSLYYRFVLLRIF